MLIRGGVCHGPPGRPDSGSAWLGCAGGGVPTARTGGIGVRRRRRPRRDRGAPGWGARRPAPRQPARRHRRRHLWRDRGRHHRLPGRAPLGPDDPAQLDRSAGQGGAPGPGRAAPGRAWWPGGVPWPLHRRPAGAHPRPCRNGPPALPNLRHLQRPGWRDLGDWVRAAWLCGRDRLAPGRAHRRAGQPAAARPCDRGGRGGAGRPLGGPPPRPCPRRSRPTTPAPMGRAPTSPLPAAAGVPGRAAAARRRAGAVADHQRAGPDRGRLGVRRGAAGRARRRRGRPAGRAGAAVLRRPPRALAHPAHARRHQPRPTPPCWLA
jgi:hypothetical protein